MAMSFIMKFPTNRIVTKALRSFNTKFEKRKKLNTRIGIKALTEINKQFQTDGKNFETPWDDLAPVTKQRRRRGKGSRGTKILRDTGLLKNSFNYSANDIKVTIGTATKYAGYHQFGTKRKGRKVIPARPMLPKRRRVAIDKISKPVVDDYIKNERKRIFGK